MNRARPIPYIPLAPSPVGEPMLHKKINFFPDTHAQASNITMTLPKDHGKARNYFENISNIDILTPCHRQTYLQILALVSPLPVANRPPFGLGATLMTEFL